VADLSSDTAANQEIFRFQKAGHNQWAQSVYPFYDVIMFSIRYRSYRDTDQTWSICPDVWTNPVSSPQPLCGTIAQEELAAVETYKATDRAREGQWKTNDLTKNGFTSKNGDGFSFKAYNFVVEHPNGGINIHKQQILPCLILRDEYQI